MIRLIKFLFTGDWHLHTWEVYKKGSLFGKSKEIPKGHYFYLKCTKCGDIKEKRFR
jgi:hypothetical protein